MLKPALASGYTRIHRAGPDHYRGPSVDGCEDGRLYEGWVPNDHTVVRGKDGRWHIFGITGPEGVGVVHGGEFQSLHIVSPGSDVSMEPDSWVEEPKVLRPTDRPGETLQFYAPCALWHGGRCLMFYSPREIRYATSADLYTWEPQGTAFPVPGSTRDPMVLKVGGAFIMYLCTDGGQIVCWTSPDLLQWAEGGVVYQHANPAAACESPFVVALGGIFYLFYTIYDGTHGNYDNRTYVYASEDPLSFPDSQWVADLPAHAPEVFADDDGKWYITSVEWPNRGISIARLDWVSI